MMPDASFFDARYFATHYSDYEAQNPRRKMEFYESLIRRTSKGQPSVETLDIGCGLGRFAAHLAQSDDRFRVRATDLSDYAIAQNRSSFPDVEFRRAGATDLPWPADTFDVITALDVLEHVPEVDEVASSVTTMLRAQGAFIFVVPVYDGPFGPVIRLLDKDPTHVHKWNRAEWLRWAQTHFELVDWIGIFRYLLPTGQYLHWPSTTFRRYAPAIAVIARAP